MGTTADKLKGKLKKVEGELTDDKVRQGQGWVEEKGAEVREGIDRVVDKVDQKIDEAQRDRRDDDNNERPVR